jgi:hypothetical protein
MTYNLFLDDIRYPEDCFEHTHQPVYIMEDWVIVRSYDEFVKYVQENGLPEIISFDHDLADTHYDNQEHVDNDFYDIVTEKTGYHCAKWLIDYCIDNKKELPATILIHSWNHAGSENIKSLFNSYFKSLDLPSATT